MTKPKRLEWFHCYPEKWLAALAGMDPIMGYVYFVVCLRIYERRGPIPDSADELKRRCNFYRTADVRRALDQLIDLGKLARDSNGHLTNPFADIELNGYQNTTRGKHSRISKDQSSIQDSSFEKTKEKQGTLLQEIDIEDSPKGESSIEGPPKQKRRGPRQPMPEHWEPDEKGILFARHCQFTDEKIQELVVACRDYHLRNGTLIAGVVGLQATWRTWCNNEIKFSKQRQARYGNGHFPTRPTREESILAGVRRAADQMARHRDTGWTDAEIFERGDSESYRRGKESHRIETGKH